MNRLELTESLRSSNGSPARVAAFWVTIFLLPTFFQRLFIGGEADSYKDFGGVDLVPLGYIVHLMIVGRHIVAPGSISIARFILVRFIPLLFISTLHIIALQLSGEIGAQSATLAIARQLIWVLTCLIMVRFAEPRLLLVRIIQLTHFTFSIIALTYLFYLATEVPVQMIFLAGVPRAQGFLSEPSAMGCLIAGYSALAVYEFKWRRLLVAAVISLLVNSVICYTGFIIGVLSGMIQLVVISSWLRRICIVCLLSLMPMAIVTASMFGHEISVAANNARGTLESTSFSNTYLYSQFVLRMLDAASLLETGIELVKTGSNDVEGGIFRLVSVLLLFEQLQQSWHLYVGYGLGAHAQLLEATGQSLLDFGLFAFVISSFGFFGGVGVFGWFIWTVSRTVKPLAVYIVPFIVIISINPAGGMHMYSIALLAALLLSRDGNKLLGVWRLMTPRRSKDAETSNSELKNPISRL